MKKKITKNMITEKQFIKKYNKSKSKSQIVLKHLNNVQPGDYKLVCSFLNDNISELTNHTIYKLLCISFADNKENVKGMIEYSNRWLSILFENNISADKIAGLLPSARSQNILIPPDIEKQIMHYMDSHALIPSDTNKEESLYETFIQLMDTNNYEEALVKFKEIWETNFKQSKVAFWLAEHFASIGDYDHAAKLIDYALRDKPKHSLFINFKNKMEDEKNPIPLITIKPTENIAIESLDEDVANVQIEVEEKEENEEKSSWNTLSKKQLLVKYNLKIFQWESLEFIHSVVANKEENEGYLSYFNANKNNIGFLHKLFTSKYRLDDDTRTGYVRALNKLTSIYIFKKDNKNALLMNNLALEDKENNNDALGFKMQIQIANKSSLALNKDNIIRDAFVQTAILNNDGYIDIHKKLEHILDDRKKNKYIKIVSKFTKYKSTYYFTQKHMEEEISKKLSFIGLDIKQMLRPYMFKVEDRIIVLAEMHGYENNDNTAELYDFMKSQKHFHKIMNKIIFNVDKLKTNSYEPDSIFSDKRNKELYIILINIFRNIRNFLVHSPEGIFNYKYSAYSDNSFSNKQHWIDDLLDNLEDNHVVKIMATEEAREEHNIFHLILMMLLITNNSKIAFSILSQIDYMLYVFICSIDKTSQKQFYNAIGLKYDWFNNMVNVIKE